MSMNQTPNNQNSSSHKLTEEGTEELKTFGKKLIFLWILQNVLIQMIDDEIFPDSVWIPFVVSIMVWVFIALTILRWLNMGITFFEETEWNKERKASNPYNRDEYELTEEGKEIIKNLIRRAVYMILLFYLINKLISNDVVDFELGILGVIFPIIIFYLIYNIFQQREKLAIKKPGSGPISQPEYRQISQEAYEQYSDPSQPVDIFGSNTNMKKQRRVTRQASSKPISNDNSGTMFSSKIIKEHCKKCFGGLNEQGKCNQCDQKW